MLNKDNSLVPELTGIMYFKKEIPSFKYLSAWYMPGTIGRTENIEVGELGKCGLCHHRAYRHYYRLNEDHLKIWESAKVKQHKGQNPKILKSHPSVLLLIFCLFFKLTVENLKYIKVGRTV